MIVEAIHPETGERYRIDIPSLTTADLDRMTKEYMTDEKIKSYIEKLPVSAEIKVVLFKLSKFTIKVGQILLKLGKKVLEIVVMLASKYKHATLGVLIGALLTVLISTIPVLGPPLSSFLGSLLMLFGLGKGLWEDVKKDSPELAASITEAGMIFQPLNAGAASEQ